MDAYEDEPCAASLKAYRLRSEADDHNGAAVCEHRTKRLASWNGRAVIVGIAVTTVILAAVSVVVPGLPR
ncbi:hypothetical protein QFZ32_000391 [Streptomyces canus]|uniref:Uncharacterized protein n=1 Tax=Streptomyces canus TaxID=58343 RepID=A0AAW8F4L3_9ACTN|nr:hypothetical protein [Streptomyces canus]MDQ0905046.1 hypothetical protein [Streptomyces canus]MDQ1064952.1 hypothetical protein [Streptomyces canus]